MYERHFKRLIDIVVSFTALVILAPVLLILTISGAVMMRGNPFFTQLRPGKDEKIFRLVKFCSMTNAKDENGELLPDEMRLTRYGKFLRSTSLDELPELWNILKGDMSLVGPRPLLVKYLPRYTQEQKKRHNVRPGLTGLAQINGRNAISWEEKFELDIKYVEKITFLKDMKILIGTVAIVFNRDGIHSENNATMEEFLGKYMNILFCSVGRRGELVKNFKESLGDSGKVIATDISPYAPALYIADKQYIVPRIDAPDYISTILDICKREKIDAVTTFIDPEILVLAKHRKQFEELGIEVLAPYERTAEYCFDKYKMYQYLKESEIATIPTYGTFEEFYEAFDKKEIELPVFVKPRTGSGSVGARKVNTVQELKILLENDPTLIIQKLMCGEDIDVDVYIDTISKRAVSAFSKKKIETRIGGANKTISFKDEKLFETVQNIVDYFEFNGPVDMDFFCVNGEYYLSEINPRFGGAYLHAYGAGVDFVKMILSNVNQYENEISFGDYEEGIVMMMYDSVVIRRPQEIL